MADKITIMGIENVDWSAPETNQWPIAHEGELGVDVYETDAMIVVRTAVAGVKPEALSIAVSNDLLTIRGTREAQEEAEDRTYLLRECHWGPFSRSLILPAMVDSVAARATFKNGLLVIELPKTPKNNSVPILTIMEDEDA